MFRKTITAAAIAGFLVLGASSAAVADTDPTDYPATVTLTAAPPTITVGGTTTITATVTGDLETVYFGTDGTPGGSISSIVFASGTGPVAKPVVDGQATASFTASAAGDYVVAVGDGETVLNTITISVTAGSGAATTAPGLPATGGELPAAAIWMGVGAIGIGGIAVAAAVARRRASTTR